MDQFINISTYRFAPLADLKPLRAELLAQCKAWEIKGTILLSTEGINLFVAGRREPTMQLLDRLREIPGLEELLPKISESDHQPFTRMLVRIKKEIIAFGVEGIDPAKRTSPKLPPRELKRWIDEGREITLLDTRNDYEIKLGTFKNALPAGIRHFRDFPKAVAEMPADLKRRPVVMFCTGGIRCEKAGPYLESQGFEHVFQLEGGILKYFEEVGSDHYDGDCFVFDQRVGVDPSLHETSNATCFACLTPLTAEEQQDTRYLLGESCPYCFKSDEDRMRAKIEERHRRLSTLIDPLPGSEPYDQYRPLKVPLKYDGKTVGEFLSGILRHIRESDWQREFANGRILGPDYFAVKPDDTVRAGERYYHLWIGLSEPPVNAQLRILYEDEAIVILQKPAPLPIHPCGRFNRNTLQYFLDKLYAPQKPRAAHRLDANTTGLLLVTRTRHFAGLLQPQFSRGEVQKKYLARVYGTPPEDRFVCDLAISEQTMETGARRVSEDGLPARTEFKVIERYPDGTSLLEVEPITGRTNQIRIHLWELGWPIVGEQLYLPDKKLGKVQTGDPEEDPLCLHAKSISFIHPLTKKRMCFEAEGVGWATAGPLNL